MTIKDKITGRGFYGSNTIISAFADTNGDGTGTFDWTPDYTQSGDHIITFTADDGIATDDEIVIITVIDINRPPTADAGFDQFDVRIGTLVTLDGSGSSDPDFCGVF